MTNGKQDPIKKIEIPFSIMVIATITTIAFIYFWMLLANNYLLREEAEARAYSNKILNESITPQILEYERIKNCGN